MLFRKTKEKVQDNDSDDDRFGEDRNVIKMEINAKTEEEKEIIKNRVQNYISCVETSTVDCEFEGDTLLLIFSDIEVARNVRTFLEQNGNGVSG